MADDQTPPTAKKTTRPERLIFVHSKLDEYGLDPYEFRLYAHIARRGDCFAAMKRTATICGMSVRKAQSALKVLCEAGMIAKKTRGGRTNVYRLTPPDQWQDKHALDTIRQRASQPKSKNGINEAEPEA